MSVKLQHPSKTNACRGCLNSLFSGYGGENLQSLLIFHRSETPVSEDTQRDKEMEGGMIEAGEIGQGDIVRLSIYIQYVEIFMDALTSP